MIQDLYQKALKFAGEKHAHQKVPGTEANYLLHISSVAMEILLAYTHAPTFDLALAIQAAILHDVLEDTDTDYQEVQELFGDRVAKAVSALTKNTDLPTKREQMLDSLKRINQGEKETGIVKLADRITNLQKPPAHWSKEKAHAYREEAKLIVETLVGKNDYLHQRLLACIDAYRKFL